MHHVYYLSYVQYLPLKSYLAAIDVETSEWLIKDVDFSNGALVEWDFDIDTHGVLHFISRSAHSLCHNAMCLVDTNTYDPSSGRSQILHKAVASSPKLSYLIVGYY